MRSAIETLLALAMLAWLSAAAALLWIGAHPGWTVAK